MSSSGNSLFLLDTKSKKCGVFVNGTFDGFTTWMDKIITCRVGVIGVISSNGGSSIIVNDVVESSNKSVLECAREIQKIGGNSHTLIYRGKVGENKVNGYLFLYLGGESKSSEVRGLCRF